MERVISISLLCSLLLVDVLGQYYLRFDYGFHRDRVYGSGETLRCRGYDRKFYRQNSTAKIIIGQNLVNGTHIELSSCPMIRKTRCSAKLVNGGCGRVNLTCSIVRNETEERKITREVLIADEASIESFYIRHKGVNNENATQFFPSESLIKVVCRGDVSTFNYEVLENLTLTWAWGNGFLKFKIRLQFKQQEFSMNTV
ncbi:uncharacterized protein LOC134260940, partial [Saccostrea cucullata]|uniref:uncharacterized protein LOC134260940 n=1 Tax=Saccostrea cuccullata TaxID=36930 RepID=UPI002ED2A8CA